MLRLYESTGSAVKASLCTALNVRSAQLTDLLERPLRRLAVRGSTVPLAFGPFEVVTVRIG